jgi:hypothetical protein
VAAAGRGGADHADRPDGFTAEELLELIPDMSPSDLQTAAGRLIALGSVRSVGDGAGRYRIGLTDGPRTHIAAPVRAPISKRPRRHSSTVALPPDSNPWLTIWTQPRRTIRGIVDSDPRRGVLLLALLGGIATAAVGWSSPNPVPLAVALGAGAILGVPTLYLIGALVRWTGRWLGGEASQVEVRAAMAWSRVPLILALPAAVSLDILILQGVSSPLVVLLARLRPSIQMWEFAVFLKCLGEVHNFSDRRALGAALLADAATLFAHHIQAS